MPSGFALAVLVCYLWPMPAPATPAWHSPEPGRSRRLGARYAAGAALLLALAATLGAWGWLLAWPALALGVLTLAYWRLGPAALQKHAGRRRFARVLLWPYSVVARLVHGYFLRRLPGAEEVVEEVWLGPVSAARDARFVAVLDLAAEYDRQAPAAAVYHSQPLLDLLLPPPAQLRQAALALQQLRASHRGPLLVHCALGLTRSAVVLLAWLVLSGRASTVEQARALLRQRRQRVELSDAQCAELARQCARMEPL